MMRTLLLNNLCKVFLVIERDYQDERATETYSLSIEGIGLMANDTLATIPLTNEQTAMLAGNLATAMGEGP